MATTLTPALHRHLLAAYVARVGSDAAETRKLAARYQLIPLYLDWVGFFGLRVDGEILFVAWDPPSEPEIVAEPHMRRVALTVGSDEYPDLAFLRPQRPRDAIVCPSCEGAGRVRLDGMEPPTNLVCYCGGLGWIPPEERRAFLAPDA